MFKRTYSFTSAAQPDVLIKRLLGSHVLIHNVDFEILEEEGQSVSIQAHGEQIEEVKTLPDTMVYFTDANGKTNIKIVAEVREFDRGAPMLVMIFCTLVYIAASLLYFAFQFKLASYIVLAVALGVTITFVVRMQTGYFDYVKKVIEYVKTKTA